MNPLPNLDGLFSNYLSARKDSPAMQLLTTDRFAQHDVGEVAPIFVILGVETGVLRANEKVIVMPSGVTGEVKSIETHHTQMESAEAGDNIGFNLRGVDNSLCVEYITPLAMFI